MQRLLPLVAILLCACATVPPASASPVAGLGQVASIDGIRVRPLAVIEDSRCPIDVVCVWAGRLVVRAEVSGGNWRQARDLELGKPQAIADGRLTLVAAEPSKMAGTETDPRAYRFTFAFEGGL